MKVRRGVLAAIAAHARRDAPRECCGLLLGTATDIVEAVPARNIAAEPSRRYEIAPDDHFAAIRRCRSGAEGLAVVGGYHSHPRSQPVPSPTDLEQAFLEFIYVIAGPVDGSAPLEVRAYQLRDGALGLVTFSISD
ncbi:MAG: M67 family peptidase [Acidobacteria bacterium]|nr:M67 family peptidase [Acidobacteriota bacterium]